MPKTRKLLIASLTLGAVTIGTAVAIDKRPDSPGPGASSEELVEAARSAYELHRNLYKNARGSTVDDVCAWSKRWMTAEWDLSPGTAEATKVVKAHFDRMLDVEALAKAQRQFARGNTTEFAAVKYYRTEAELMMARTGR